MNSLDIQKQLDELIPLLLEHLPGNWIEQRPSNDPSYHWTNICREDGGSLSINGRDWREKNQWEVSANWPKGPNNEIYHPLNHQKLEDGTPMRMKEIYISKNKSPEAIAKDIERRFLKKYDVVFAIMQQRIEARQNHLDQKLEVLNELAKITGVTIEQPVYKQDTDIDSKTAHLNMGNYGTATVEVNSPTSCNIEISYIPSTLAVKVLGFLSEQVEIGLSDGDD